MKSQNYCKPHPSCRTFVVHLRCIALANGSEPVTLLLRFGYALVTLTSGKQIIKERRKGVRKAKGRGQ